MSSPSSSVKLAVRTENSFKAIMLPSVVGMADSIMAHVLA